MVVPMGSVLVAAYHRQSCPQMSFFLLPQCSSHDSYASKSVCECASIRDADIHHSLHESETTHGDVLAHPGDSLRTIADAGDDPFATSCAATVVIKRVKPIIFHKLRFS